MLGERFFLSFSHPRAQESNLCGQNKRTVGIRVRILVRLGYQLSISHDLRNAMNLVSIVFIKRHALMISDR